MRGPKKILLVGFNSLHEQLVKESVNAAQLPVQIFSSATLPHAIGILKHKRIALIISEYLTISEPDNWINRYQSSSHAPVIVLTHRDDDESAVKCMKAGATDFLQKSEDTLKKLPEIICKALKAKPSQRKIGSPSGIKLIRQKLKNLTDLVSQYPNAVTRLRDNTIDLPKELENIKSMIKNFMT